MKKIFVTRGTYSRMGQHLYLDNSSADRDNCCWQESDSQVGKDKENIPGRSDSIVPTAHRCQHYPQLPGSKKQQNYLLSDWQL